MNEHTFLARGRVVDEPRLLKFQPRLGVELVQLVPGHRCRVDLNRRSLGINPKTQIDIYWFGIAEGGGLDAVTCLILKSEKETVAGVSPAARTKTPISPLP